MDRSYILCRTLTADLRIWSKADLKRARRVFNQISEVHARYKNLRLARINKELANR